MPTKRPVSTSGAAAPRLGAPYSQAIVAEPFVFVSGQLPLEPATGEIVPGGIAAQTERTLLNLGEVLHAAGSRLDAIVKTTVFLTDLEDWAAMNDVYRRFVGTVPPARSAIECGRLALGARIEIDAIALVTDRGSGAPGGS
jgi:2-iminobutanoate/2-iminopropanoate deaminase